MSESNRAYPPMATLTIQTSAETVEAIAILAATLKISLEHAASLVLLSGVKYLQSQQRSEED